MRHLNTRIKVPLTGWLFIFPILLLTNHSFSQTVKSTTQTYVVRYDSNIKPGELDQIRKQLNSTLSRRATSSNLEVWEIPVEKEETLIRSRSRIQESLSQKLGIKQFEIDHPYDISIVSEDPFEDQQWYTQSEYINSDKAWEIHRPVSTVVAAYIDTGVDFTHEDLVENIWQNLAEDADKDGKTIEYVNGQWILDPGDLDGVDNDGNGYIDDLIGWDFVNDDNNPFDDNGHGTHVAGIIAGTHNNAKGIKGVGKSTQLMALKAFDADGSGSVSTILPAMEYARKMNARIINNSWGGVSYSNFIFEEVLKADRAGILITAAAGNSSTDLITQPIYPASYDADNIITIAASDKEDRLAPFSNFSSSEVDLAAPGVNIYSTIPGNKYGYRNGTSMATPIVTGTLGLLWSALPSLKHNQVKSMLLSTVDLSPNLYGLCKTGGRLNVFTAVQLTTEICEDWLRESENFEINSLTNDGDLIWAATNKGLFRVNKKTCEINLFNKDNSIIHDKLVSVAVDQTGKIWIGGEKDGIFTFDGNNWESFNKKNSPLPTDKIFSVLIDFDNTVWVGTDGKGLVSIKDTTWTIYDKDNSLLEDDKVNHMSMGSDGTLLFCTKKGVAILRNGEWDLWNEDNSNIPSAEILSAAMSEHEIWLGTKKGLSRYSQNKWETFDKQLPDSKVTSIEIDENDVKWFATKKGLVTYDNQSWNVYEKENSNLPDNEIYDLEDDLSENVWGGTKKGIFLFSNSVIASFDYNYDICLGQSYTFENTSIGGNAFEWKINGNTVSRSLDLTYTFTEPGQYIVTLIVSNDLSNDAMSKSIYIDHLPSIDLGEDTSVCANTVVLDACVQGQKYSWYNQDHFLISKKKQLSVKESGKYKLTVEDGCGNSVSDEIKVDLTGDCVWPGDANADGLINIIDFLALGVAQEATGPERITSGDNFQAYEAADWPTSFTNNFELFQGVNHKYADSDGNGKIEIEKDVEAISKHFNISHLDLADEITSSFELELKNLSTTLISSNQALMEYSLSLKGGRRGESINSLYGLAFSLNLNMPLSEEPELILEDSWLGDVESLILDYSNRINDCEIEDNYQLDIGISRTDHTNTSGYGIFGRMRIVVVIDDLQDDTTRISDYVTFNITPSNVIFTDVQGTTNQIGVSNTTSGTTQIFTGCALSSVDAGNTRENAKELDIHSMDALEDIICYSGDVDWFKIVAKPHLQMRLAKSSTNPTPQNRILNIDLSKIRAHHIITLYDEDGNNLWVSKDNAQSDLHLQHILTSPGVYYLKIEANENFTHSISHPYSVVAHLDSIQTSLPASTMFYPNPTKNHVWISLPSGSGEIMKVRILSLAGQALDAKEFSEHSSKGYVRYSLPPLPNGLYFIERTYGGQKETNLLQIFE